MLVGMSGISVEAVRLKRSEDHALEAVEWREIAAIGSQVAWWMPKYRPELLGKGGDCGLSWWPLK